MITLARQIELLLLSHDCVIVPGLGGFIANRAEAAYSEQDDKLFIPPHRTIGFNQKLQINDGLLVQSYMAVYDTSYPNAYLQMEKEIDQLVQQLDITGTAVLENIGTLYKPITGNITFEAPQAGALTPDLYGLYSFEIKSLAEVIREKEIARTLTGFGSIDVEAENTDSQVKAEQNSNSDEHTSSTGISSNNSNDGIGRHIGNHWLDIAISAAAAVLLFFCFSYPAMKDSNNVSDTCVAAFYPAPEQQKVDTAAHTDVKPSEATQSETLAAETSSETAAPEKAVADKTKTETKTETKDNKTNNKKLDSDNGYAGKKFSIVLASCVNKENAENFIKHLKAEGYPEARFAEGEGSSKLNRVLYSHYSTSEEAHQALQTLRSENSNFASAWILEQ